MQMQVTDEYKKLFNVNKREDTYTKQRVCDCHCLLLTGFTIN